MARSLTPEEKHYAQELFERARRAMCLIENYDQARIDRLCQAVGWATAEPTRRAKVQGILRDALRQKSIGVIEEIPEKGIVKYAKPVGVIASLVPVTNASLT